MNALDLLAGLVLENGARWGQVAAPWQWDAAKVLLDQEAPPYRWESRPRGGSKTTDAAGMVLVAVTASLRPGSRCFCFASDRDQARLLTDALAGLVRRTEELSSYFDLQNYRVVARNGSVIEVMSADAASSWGILPSVVVADEVVQWPSTTNARTLWESIYSSLGKVPGARLLCISTSGDPSHWSRRIYDTALESPLWTVADVPGPVEWVSSEYLDEQRRMLPESSFRRLHLNEWCASEDRLTSPEQVRQCVGHSGVLPPEPGRRYVAGLDVGLTNDRTVLTVAHLDRRPAGAVVVVDRQWTWRGTRANPVLLTDVEAVVVEALRSYGGARLVADPFQAVHLCQRLRARGVRVEEFSFSSASVGRLALTLYRLLRDVLLDLPDDEDLVSELSSVKLVETAPGCYRIDHASGEHDDRVVSVALCALHLLERPDTGDWGRLYAERCERCETSYSSGLSSCPSCGEPRPKVEIDPHGWGAIYQQREQSPLEQIMRTAMPQSWFGGGPTTGGGSFGGRP